MVNILEIACKHSISSSVTSKNFILGMCMAHMRKMIPIIFGKGQRSFGVTRGQKVQNLSSRISVIVKLGSTCGVAYFYYERMRSIAVALWTCHSVFILCLVGFVNL